MKVFTDGNSYRRRTELLKIMAEPGNEDVLYVASTEEALKYARMLMVTSVQFGVLPPLVEPSRFRHPGVLYPDPDRAGRLPRRRVVIEDGDVILGQPALLITREVEILAMSLSVPVVSLADPATKPAWKPQDPSSFEEAVVPTTVTRPSHMIVELSPTDRELLAEVARNTRRREAVTVISPVPGSDGSVRVDVVDPRRGVIPMPDTHLTTDEGDDRG